MTSPDRAFLAAPSRMAHRLLPRELTVITTSPSGSRDLFARLEHAHHRIQPIDWGTPAMVLTVTAMPTPCALLDLPHLTHTGQALTHLRHLQRHAPTIVLAEETIDAAPLFDADALDVIARNAEPIEQLTRIAAHWRRRAARPQHPYAELLAGHLPRLPHGEQRLLEVLLATSGPVSPAQLRRGVGRNGAAVSERTLTRLVDQLNLRLRPLALEIRDGPGAGYRLDHQQRLL
ncbi:hypothetical protein [Kitasatospora sp. NPDC088346]|uniref:hypothetical protein n=1 Tax=Kitasatospora sp. NPDC088346 TaxID=3364073 RepID=UPI0038081D44